MHYIIRKIVKRISEKKKASKKKRKKKAVGSDSYQVSPSHLMNDQIVTYYVELNNLHSIWPRFTEKTQHLKKQL